MKNKNLFLVAIFLLSFILNGLTVYANNYRSEASLALKQLDTSKYFIALKNRIFMFINYTKRIF